MSKYIFRRETRQPAVQPVNKKSAHRRRDLTPFAELFNEREKTRIIRKIFGNDPARFKMFMNTLNGVMTWQEAYNAIEKELQTRRIELDMEEAIQLTDRIYRVFFPDDISIGA